MLTTKQALAATMVLALSESQADKALRTAKLRRRITAKQKLQDAVDYAHIVEKREGSQMALSIGDMASCGTIPLLNKERTQDRPRDGTSAFGKVQKVTEENSGIFKDLRGLGPRTGHPQLQQQQTTSTRSKKQQQSKKSNATTTNDKLVAATEMARGARDILDSSRLFFEAAILFDEIGMLEKARKCFVKSTLRHDAGRIVDTYDLPENTEFKRKVERMSEGHRNAFLAQRAQLRTNLIAAEEERQRLRAMVSHCQLMRVNLLLLDYESSHAALVSAFQTCVSSQEHSELLVYSHSVLKEFADKSFGEFDRAQTIVRGSAGPLAEAHLNVLKELLEEDARNPDVLEWLGRRYAEKCDFETSSHFFKRARDIREPVRGAEDARNLWLMRPQGVNDVEVLAAISKHRVRSFAQDLDADEEKAAKRVDFSAPEGCHAASSTILYLAPPQGWDRGSKAQLERFEFRGESFKLTPPKTTPF